MEKRFLALLELTLLIRCCLAIILGSKAVKYFRPIFAPTSHSYRKEEPQTDSRLPLTTQNGNNFPKQKQIRI
jgi:hypothetical protein